METKIIVFILQVMETGFPTESICRYMVVFHYGSTVLFNVSDHEAQGYLKIVEKNASGLLPEMRKDGKYAKVAYMLFSSSVLLVCQSNHHVLPCTCKNANVRK